MHMDIVQLEKLENLMCYGYYYYYYDYYYQ